MSKQSSLAVFMIETIVKLRLSSFQQYLPFYNMGSNIAKGISDGTAIG